MLLEGVAAAVMLTGANYLDYSSTREGLERGGVEVNALIGKDGQRLAVTKALAVGVETGVFLALRRRHPKAAWAFVGAIVATNIALAHHNNGVMR